MAWRFSAIYAGAIFFPTMHGISFEVLSQIRARLKLTLPSTDREITIYTIPATLLIP